MKYTPSSELRKFFISVKNNGSRLYTPQLNHISMKMPSFALLPGRSRIDPKNFCNESTVSGCVDDYCECTHIVNVPLKSVVEIVLVDEGFNFFHVEISTCNFFIKHNAMVYFQGLHLMLIIRFIFMVMHLE